MTERTVKLIHSEVELMDDCNAEMITETFVPEASLGVLVFHMTK